MKERRYRDSYRLVTRVDPKTGKPREAAVYAGDYYHFPERAQARRRTLRCAAGVALYWALAVAHLCLCRVTGRCMYALVPFMLGVMPGLYALMGLWTTLRLGARMTVVERENGPGRLARSTLGCAATAAAGAVGCAVCLTLEGLWAEGWTEPLLAAAASAAAWAAFAECKKLENSIEKV